MKRLWTLFCLTACVALAAQQVVIVATADLHGSMATFARLAVNIRAQNPDVLVDAGDLFSGNFATIADGGASMVTALNLLRYDAWVPGNHDFDLPCKDVAKLVAAFHGQTLGNWRTPEIPGVKPWMLLQRKKLRIFIIGCGVPDQQSRLVPDGKFTQNSYDDSLAQGIAAARKANASLVILIAHRGLFGKDGRLAELLSRHPGIDLVIGSHTHQPDRGENIGDTYFVQPGAHAQNAACVTITFDEKTQKISQIESVLISPAETSDRKLEKLLADTEKHAALVGDTPEIALDDPMCLPLPGMCDRDFVHFAAEAMCRAAGSRAAIYDGYADHRVLTSPVTPRKLFAMAPYDGHIIVCRMTDEEIRGVMEEMLDSMSLTKPGAVPGFAGICYALKRKKLVRLELPAELEVAIGSYRFCRAKALAALRADSRRWRDTGILERDAIWQEILRRNQK